MKNEAIRKELNQHKEIIKDVQGCHIKDGNIIFNKEILPKNCFIRQFIEFYSQLTEAPDEFLLTSILTYLSGMIGNHAYIQDSISLTYPNIWSVLIAKTTSFRKSTTLNISENLLKDAGFDFLFPQVIHAHTFIEKLEYNPFGIFVYNEWKSFAKIIESKNGSDLKALLTELYDKHSYKKILKNQHYNPKEENSQKFDTVKIENVAISIAVATTIDWMLPYLERGDMESGFLPRFIFSTIETCYKPPIPFPKDKSNSKLIDNLKKYKGKIEAWDKIELKISPESKEIYKTWYYKNYEEKKNTDNEMIGGFFGRLEKYIMKFAMIIHLTSEDIKGNVILPETMKAAIQLQEYYRENIKYLIRKEFTNNRYQKVENTIIDYLKKRKAQNKITTKRELQSYTGRICKSSSLFKIIIDNLIEDKKIKIKKSETGGNPKKIVELIEYEVQ